MNELLTALPKDDLRLFQSICVLTDFEKGDMLIGEGTIATKMFFLEKGWCRSYFVKDGDDITDFFFFEESFATDYASLCGNKPSQLNLVCEENVRALVIRSEDLNQLYRTNHRLSEVGRIMAEYSFLSIEERMRMLHTESPETKYQWMVTNFPTIFQRVPQYHIASFLGVKPQSLSRIRAKIAGKIY